jgi:hypothetical protein
MDPASPSSPSQDALLILRSIDDLRADFSGQLAEIRADSIGLQDRVSFTEAQLESLEDRLITTDQRAITVQEQLRTHVNDCTSPAIDISILERLCAVESSQQELRAENKQIRMENQQLRALLTAKEHTSPSRDSPPSQPSTSSSDPALLARVQFLTNELVTIRKELREEERKRDNLEANSRLYNLEIAGLPVVNPGSDNPLELARKLVTEVTGGRVQESAVDVAHRKAGGPKNIILRFRTRTDRDKVYAAKKRLMTMSRIGYGYDTEAKIFLNESLTFDRSALMRAVRKRIRSVNDGKVGAQRYKLLTDRGVIKVKAPNQPYRKITCMDDLESLL